MKNTKLITLSLLSVMLFACNNPDHTTNTSSESEKNEQKTTSAFSAQKDALKKAEAVEQMLQDTVQQREEEMRKKGT